MPIALLAGAFGQGNLGDDALLQAFVNALPEWHLRVTTSDPAAAEQLGCEPVPPVAPRRSRPPPGLRRHPGRRGHRVQDPPSLLGPAPAGLLANTSALVAVSSALHRPVAMVGVGAGRLDGRRARALSRFIVKHADLLVLRDEESAAEMFSSGIPGPFRIGADPAWTLVVPPDRVPAAHDGAVRVVPSTWPMGPTGGPAWSTGWPTPWAGCCPWAWPLSSRPGSTAPARPTGMTAPLSTRWSIGSARRSRWCPPPGRWTRRSSR